MTDSQTNQPYTPEIQPEPATLSAEDSAESTLAATEVTQLAELTKELETWKDKAYRLAAEMENLRRRQTQDLENAKSFSLQSFAKELLPVADNLTRALDAAAQEDPLRNGVTMVAANFQQTLAKQGINKIIVEPGQPFNHDHHQVMAQVPSTFPANHVVAELQAGFTLNGRLLRPAFVTVSTGSPPESVN